MWIWTRLSSWQLLRTIEKHMFYEVCSKRIILRTKSRVKRMWESHRYLSLVAYIVICLIWISFVQLLFDQDIFTPNYFHSDPRPEINDIRHLKSVDHGKYLLVNLNESSKKEVSPSTRDGTCVCDNTCGLYPECCCDWFIPESLCLEALWIKS